MKRLTIRASLLLVCSSASLLACAAEDPDDQLASESSSVTSKGKWSLPSDVRAAGAKVKITYDGAPRWPGKCATKLAPGSRVLGDFLDDEFDGIKSIGGLGCRPNTANQAKMSVHGTGRALDIMIPMKGGAADAKRGDAIANWLVMNASRIGVQLIIWNRTVWRANGSNEKAYTGPHPHNDHLHVEITDEAAAQKMPWFSTKHAVDPNAPTTGGAPNESEEQEEAPPEEDQATPPPEEERRPSPREEGPQGQPPPAEPEPSEAGEGATPPPADEAPPTAGASIPLPEKAEELGDGPGEAEKSEHVLSKKANKPDDEPAPVTESSGCGVSPTKARADLALLAGAVALAAVLRRRRRA